MELTVVGGGLAGCEAAWQAAERGVKVALYEMRPILSTGAHRTGKLAELVCSNSLGSNLPNRASGLLKAELRQLKSLLIDCADASAIPAGGALAVDREQFSDRVEDKLTSHPKIDIIRQEIQTIPLSPAILATGPLTSQNLSEKLLAFTDHEHLFFFDAIAPVIEYGSINFDVAFRADRYDYDKINEGDYVNCPFDKDRYQEFLKALIQAERIPLQTFETEIDGGVDAGTEAYFQRCQPIEVLAQKGERALLFGPLRPVGLVDPRTGRRPYAVVQLRQDTLAGDLYNLVGFQTNLTHAEQVRVFRMIPGLENVKFQRFGQMHRNTYLAAPRLLDKALAFHKQPGLFVAGQLSGTEGYAGNIASGLVAGINAAHYLLGKPPLQLPMTTMTGALIHYITHAEAKSFQPMKAMFGLLPEPDQPQRLKKIERHKYFTERALTDLDNYIKHHLKA
jgi:methylenetetrahydrofolate--tRNA-(uracil-5-)-methyltransferase